MDNLEAATILVQMYGKYARCFNSDPKTEEAVALAIGALRKDSERKNESN